MADSDLATKGAFISEKTKKEEDEQQFRPHINKKSREMANGRSVENLYRDGLREKKER